MESRRLQTQAARSAARLSNVIAKGDPNKALEAMGPFVEEFMGWISALQDEAAKLRAATHQEGKD
ncbi:hypothetical protein ACFOGJ_16000 [Marinibaculum pumilum]|uniref:Uncharacterized protein n=1 Tax=Marinibaculum pumilum TaxID=1766165 RepID=A0ABV7L2B5_9PROT